MHERWVRDSRGTGAAFLRLVWSFVLGACVLVGAIIWGLVGGEAGSVAASNAVSTRSLAPKRCGPSTPCLALVIDDIGRDPRLLARFLRLPQELTFSVLPHAPHTGASVEALKRAGREYLLHLPLEPGSASAISDEPLIIRRTSHIERVFDEMAKRVPGAVGFNNHMGSVFCRANSAVARLVQRAKGRFLFVLDSKTAKDSRLCEVARASGLPCVSRDVFLDDPSDVTTVDYRLQQAMERASRRGWAVAIGHPREATLEALARMTTGRVSVVKLSMVLRANGP